MSFIQCISLLDVPQLFYFGGHFFSGKASAYLLVFATVGGIFGMNLTFMSANHGGAPTHVRKLQLPPQECTAVIQTCSWNASISTTTRRSMAAMSRMTDCSFNRAATAGLSSSRLVGCSMANVGIECALAQTMKRPVAFALIHSMTTHMPSRWACGMSMRYLLERKTGTLGNYRAGTCG